MSRHTFLSRCILCPCLFLLGAVLFSASSMLSMAHGDLSGCSEPEAVVVLGAYADEDGPCDMLQARLDAAIDFIQLHPHTPIVVAGGQGDNEPRPEAEAMAEYLIGAGIPARQILLEDRSRNTFQNLANARNVLGDNVDHVVVVSNGFHLFRAALLARRVGFSTVSTLAPDNDPSSVYMYFRESLAIIKSVMIDR